MQGGNLRYQFARLSIAEKLIALNVLSFNVYGRLDLTEDKLFTMSPAAVRILEDLLGKPIRVRTVPPGMLAGIARSLTVLGALFRSSTYQRSQSELVVIITPHLVTPTRGEALALPTDRVRPPTEAELFLFGQTSRPAGAPKSGPAAEVAKQDFTGSYGYVME